ncbi:MAG: helix-turn-helix transcriptional regulator [Bacillota bacterium]|nr:helix-turn-helix transcriptional regulator [Bacillota bacterium]
MNKTIQERLRTLREEAGLSQEKLASTLGVTRMTIAGYELGKRPPDSIFIDKACSYFGCTPDYIFGISPFKNNEHFDKWANSSAALEKSLNMQPENKRDTLTAVLSWFLQDNGAVSQFSEDKDYMIDNFINLIIAYTDIFKEFSSAVGNSDLAHGIDKPVVFDFYKSMEKDKTKLIKNVETMCRDLFEFLMSHSRNEIKNSKKSRKNID